MKDGRKVGSKISFNLVIGQCTDKGYQTGQVIFMDKESA